MKKPHEETWGVGGYGDLTVGPPEGPFTPWARRIEIGTVGDVDDARLLLAAQAPAMARLLLKLQWVVSAAGRDRALTLCPSCGVSPDGRDSGLRVREPGEHAASCDIVAVLSAAGVLP